MRKPEDKRHNRTVFLILAGIVVVPMLVAYVAYFHLPGWIPAGMTNEGVLVNPPVYAGEVNPALVGSETWLLVQPVGGNCDASCEQLLYLARQVVTGLGKDAPRVKRILMASRPISDEFSSILEREHAEVEVVAGDHARLNAITNHKPVLFLIDPNGNLMMFYTLEKAGEPMLKDLKHLLRVSSIG